ncbi:hypothetical protein [Parvibacter caecicola]|uniref:hypothetical protein n=1 Tax=Parvibacter caecicola TaxID=747645 RepID=UPI00249C7B61|nr:hypothetical protein [Parvibacter caecicola]
MRFAEMAGALGWKPKLTYTVAEVVHATGIPATTVRDEISRGNLKARVIGAKKLVLLPEWVDEWLALREGGEPAPSERECLAQLLEEVRQLREDIRWMRR